MNPDSINNQPSFDLPPVKTPEGGDSNVNQEKSEVNSVQQAENSPEKRPDNAGETEQKESQPQTTPQTDDNADDGTVSNQTSDDSDSKSVPSSQDIPEIADDVDLIEKEWVQKAKNIVNKTKDDPHKQNIELNKVKAE